MNELVALHRGQRRFFDNSLTTCLFIKVGRNHKGKKNYKGIDGKRTREKSRWMLLAWMMADGYQKLIGEVQYIERRGAISTCQLANMSTRMMIICNIIPEQLNKTRCPLIPWKLPI